MYRRGENELASLMHRATTFSVVGYHRLARTTIAGVGNDLAGSIQLLAEMIARRVGRAADDDSTLDYVGLIDATVTQLEAGLLL